jgi:hypothetical protein
LCAAFAEVLEGNDYGRWHYFVELSPTWTPETLAVMVLTVLAVVYSSREKESTMTVTGKARAAIATEIVRLQSALRRQLGLPGCER